MEQPIETTKQTTKPTSLKEALTRELGEQVYTLEIEIEYLYNVLPRFTIGIRALDTKALNETYDPHIIPELEEKPDEDQAAKDERARFIREDFFLDEPAPPTRHASAPKMSYRTGTYTHFNEALNDLAHNFGLDPQFAEPNDKVPLVANSIADIERNDPEMKNRVEEDVEITPKVYKIRVILQNINNRPGVFVDFADIRVGRIHIGNDRLIETLPEEQLVNIIEALVRELNDLRRTARERYREGTENKFGQEDI